MLRVRSLGTVPYHEADALQHALASEADDDYLLLLQHPHVYTLGVARRRRATCWSTRPRVGAALERDRPGRRRDLPRPGPARGLPDRHGARRCRRPGPTTCTASSSVVIDTLADLGLPGCDQRRPSTRASGSTPTDPTRARSPPSACGPCGSARAPAHAARRRAQRRLRPRDVRPHRALRDRRPRRDLAGRPRASTSPMDEVVDAFVARAAEAFGDRAVTTATTS